MDYPELLRIYMDVQDETENDTSELQVFHPIVVINFEVCLSIGTYALTKS